MRLRGWRGALSVLGAVAIVAGVAAITLAAISLFDGGDGDVDLAGEQAPAEADDPDDADEAEGTTRTTVRRTTTTTGPAEVLGESTVRDTTPTTVAGPTTTVAAATPSPGPAPAPTPAPTTPPPTAPPTTACRNSTDPSCGTFRWDPEPASAPVELAVRAAPTEARVGEPVTFTVDYVERAGAEALGACGGWTIRGPGFSDATTCEALAHSCERYGPHDPPPPRTDQVRVTRTVTFDAPGTYEIRAEGFTATHLTDGCASPYLGSWSVEPYVLTVVDAES